MKVIRFELEGLLQIEGDVHRDARGYFLERFHAERFRSIGLPSRFVQDNHSRSLPGVLRGLYYQEWPPQGKLVGVTRGRIFAVALDIRASSATFAQAICLELDDIRCRLLWIPPGFAHGYCVRGDESADVICKVDAPYNPDSQAGIHFADPDLRLPWPLERPILSERDRSLPSFEQYRARVLAGATPAQPPHNQ